MGRLVVLLLAVSFLASYVVVHVVDAALAAQTHQLRGSIYEKTVSGYPLQKSNP